VNCSLTDQLFDKGNQQLNDREFVAAEQTFRDAIKLIILTGLSKSACLVTNRTKEIY
jgi:hypothetical protein